MTQRLLSTFAADAMSLNRTKLHWLIRLRMLATLAQAFAFIPGAELGLIEPWHFLSYFVVVLALIAFNVVSFVWLKRRAFEPGTAAICMQLAVDLVGLTLLLNFAGGWSNPFMSLYFLHAGLGALLLQGTFNGFFFLLVAGGIIITFYLDTTVGFGEWEATLPSSAILMAQVFIAFMIWMLTNWLSATLRTLNHNVQVLREQNSRLDRLRAVGAIAAGFSHQLATPLNTVKMRIERVARRQNLDDPQDQNDVSIALNGVARCEEILRTYFAGRLEPAGVDLEPTDIVALTQRVCTSWLVENPDVKLRCAVPRDLRPICRVAPVDFSRSLIDLFDNAREASPGQPVEIDVQILVHEDEVEIRIEDYGPGFSSDVMSRLGEPFVSEKASGAGLGLYTAFALTHSLSGRFSVRNQECGGGQVTICLPFFIRELPHDVTTHAPADR